MTQFMRAHGANPGPTERPRLAGLLAGLLGAVPALVLWSLRDDLDALYGDPLKIWRDWASDVRGHGIDSGHHMAEEAPSELAAALAAFFRER